MRGHHGSAGFARGDHVCGFYFGPEERDLLLRVFLREGRRAGARCTCVVDDDPEAVADRVRAELGAEGGAGDWFSVSGVSPEDRSRRGIGKERMAEFLDAAAAEARDGRHRSAWVAGEMSWALHRPDLLPELFAHEAAVNDLIDRHPQTLLCLYDLELVGARLLADLLYTHPKLLLGDVLVDNPSYVA